MKKFLLFLFTLSNLLFGLDIQTATVEELTQINGVGKVLADRIVEYRTENGISDIDELLNVKGIGKAKLAKIKKEISDNDSIGSIEESSSPIDLSKYDDQ
jgi:competence protein ComEA